MGTGIAVEDKGRITNTKMNLKLETVEVGDIDAAYMKVVSGSLVAENGKHGKIFSWQNTVESAAVLVHKVLVDVTTESTLLSRMNVGQAATEIESDNLIDGGKIDAAVVLSNHTDKGNNGEGAQHVNDDAWITGYEANEADPAGLVGKYYIFYTKIS